MRGLQFFVRFLQVAEDLEQFLLAARELAVGLLQFFLGLLGFGDVAADADQAADPAVVVAQRNFRGGMPARIAGAVHYALLAVDQRLAGTEDRAVVRREIGRQLGRKKIGERLPGDVGVARGAEELAVRDVVDHEPAGGVLHVNVVGQVVDQTAEEVALGGERGLGFFQRGDVARDAEGAGDAAGLVAQRELGREHPGGAAVGQGLVLDLADERLAGAHDLLLVLVGRLRVRRGEEIEIRFAHHLAGVVQFEPVRQRTIHPQETAAGVLEENAVGQVVEQRVEQVAFLGQQFLGALALDRVPHRVDEQPVVHLPLDQIILRAQLHGLHGHAFVIEAAQHDDRHLGRGGVRALECVQPKAVRQGHVEQHEVDAAGGQPFEAGRQPVRVDQFEGRVWGVGEVQADQAHITGIVLDEEHVASRVWRYGRHRVCDRLTRPGSRCAVTGCGANVGPLPPAFQSKTFRHVRTTVVSPGAPASGPADVEAFFVASIR